MWKDAHPSIPLAFIEFLGLVSIDEWDSPVGGITYVVLHKLTHENLVHTVLDLVPSNAQLAYFTSSNYMIRTRLTRGRGLDPHGCLTTSCQV